jgi:23S rRNA (adenine2503-C2)-methyltransferase
MPSLPNIYDFDLPDLVDYFKSLGEPAYRAAQIWQGLYVQFWNAPGQFTSLPIKVREKLSENFFTTQIDQHLSFSGLTPTAIIASSDGETQKTSFSLSDNRVLETVMMRYENRRTLCISTQSGCAMGCVFCATGQMGFGRNLSSGEIVEQVLHYARKLATQGEKVTNIVVMGMGEPFHNYDETLNAISRLSHPAGMNLGTRRFTISTVGLVPAIRRFTLENTQINLAVSLHAANDELRSSMLPINRKYPLKELIEACREYINFTHRRLSFEWALIQGVNDTREQALELVNLIQPLRQSGTLLAHVNAIPLNPINQYQGKATTRQRAEAFKHTLEMNGVPCTIRLRRGIDIRAGCGQLAGANQAQFRKAQTQASEP